MLLYEAMNQLYAIKSAGLSVFWLQFVQIHSNDIRLYTSAEYKTIVAVSNEIQGCLGLRLLPPLQERKLLPGSPTPYGDSSTCKIALLQLAGLGKYGSRHGELVPIPPDAVFRLKQGLGVQEQ